MATDRGESVRHWHCLDSEAVAAHLDSDLDAGLTAEAAKSRLGLVGLNTLHETGRRRPLAMLASQFTDFMILVLIAAAVIAGFIGEPQDTIAIVVIVFLNGIIGFVQEYRAERAMAALKKMASPQARVIRDGHPALIDATELVPGDLVELEAGNILPADLRLTELASLKVDESALTGESQPVDKRLVPLHETDLPLGDRLNLAYKGTIATYGHARGLVVATGMQTELGKIAALLSGESGKTPLQKRLARFGQHLALVVLAICAIIFVAGWLRGEPPLVMLLTAVSLAVAAIPEALPAVVTISLALGAARMVRQNALIRRLPAVETLGSVTYICSDKTGTLTQNRMQVDCVRAAGDIRPGLQDVERAPWHELGLAMALCNDAVPRADETLAGDPTETALLEAAQAAGFNPGELRKTWPRLAELPFDSDRARMSTLHREGDAVLMLVKGAPERVLALCGDQLDRNGTTAFDRAALHGEAERLAAQGLRVLAFALKRLPRVPEALDAATLETDLTFIGLAGLIDPPRPEAADAVAACQAAGIIPVMITGDHPATARAVAHRLGIVGDGGKVLTGSELARLSLAEFEREVESVRVYARINPEQKIKIVQALQDKGEFVAMTGDGVNDAPALKQADIGVAMGKGGTDVAREAAHMTLLDDNFATIVHAVREGRRIFDNIRKFVKYTMTSNSGEIWTIFLAPFLGLPIPLLPIHILWINLVTDGLPGLALAGERAERNVMQRPPRPPKESIFAHGMWQHILWVGLLMGGVTLLTQAWAIHVGTTHWQSMVFTVLTLSQLGHVLAIRSERESLFTQGVLSNAALTGALLLTVVLQMAVLYVPWLNPIFKTEPLSLGELAACLALSSVVFVGVEIEKALVRRGWLYASP
ncbi:cation-translocating P-type ATPase [Thiobacillus sp.]|uniref:cation-translocating P-type ATPase n=1 Tax=Thiobacillus sp. TaxID=924 RepID=UPI0017FCBFCD|nr:cation-translocating P-type ATPase [Thiobacillus sp.]MBC2731894.1 cation-translocating P-type ATPase [Thiobacillus sp.]MBC2740632.1 cation-translocating P-type ATPase [Thiobacillus sp.]MBC2758515.1 cation-translocating P-type ATPase [Thiobacillus sp.]